VRRPLVRLLIGLTAFILIGWGAGALWTSVVGAGDLEAVRQVTEGRSAALTAAMRVVTWAGSAWVLVPLAAGCCTVLLRRGLHREAAGVALSLGGAMLISAAVRVLVSRPRPPVEHLQAVTSASFPSGHSTQASAFWLSLVLAARAARAPSAVTLSAAVIGALLVPCVAFSRVYLGVHYPSDVIAGVLLGSGWATFVALCVEDRKVRLRSRARS
jgi:membrane-associated phospholipid phosphatase